MNPHQKNKIDISVRVVAPLFQKVGTDLTSTVAVGR